MGSAGSYCKSCQDYKNWESAVKRFGITADEYFAMLEYQQMRCAICQRYSKQRLSIDHDHDTGRVRGLLCTRCNHRLLGAAQDNIDIILRAADYLRNSPFDQISAEAA